MGLRINRLFNEARLYMTSVRPLTFEDGQLLTEHRGILQLDAIIMENNGDGHL